MVTDDWSDFLTQHIDTTKHTPKPPPPGNVTYLNADRPAYAQAALHAEAANVATAPVGTRNHTLNTAAFNLASLVDGGHLSREDVETELTIAAQQAGLEQPEIRNTIRSGFTGSATKVGARTIPDPDEENIGFDSNQNSSDGDDGPSAFDKAVARKAYELRIIDEAKALWNRQRAGQMGQQPPTCIPLPDFLAVPDEDAQYRVHELLPIGGRALLAAQYKAGKTSMIANLLRSLADGDPFLGRFTVTAPVKRIVLIDTELDERMLRRWLRDQSIRTKTAISVLALRGRLASFAITDDRARAEWAHILHAADFLILDCLRPCLDALGLSEDKEAGIFLTAFDALCRECGASEAAVVHHMGHSQDRSRGDSRLLDWPDVLWKISRDDSDDNDDRFFSAEGRDVQVGESQLDWCPETRALTICGGSRKDKQARHAEADIVDLMNLPESGDGLSQSQIIDGLKAYGIGRNTARDAIRHAIDDGTLITSRGPHRATIHTLNPSRKAT